MTDIKTIECRIQLRPEKRAYLVVKCERGFKGECKFPCWERPAANTTWHWDGCLTHPTIQPSINCLVKDCGRHFIVTKGVAS